MKASLALTLLVACSTPEEATVEAGGEPPIICVRQEGQVLFCRDFRGVVYACTNTEASDCLSILQSGFRVTWMGSERP